MGFYEPHYVVLKIKNHIVWFFGTHAPMKGGLGDLIGYQLCQLVLKRRLDLASCYPVLYELLSSVFVLRNTYKLSNIPMSSGNSNPILRRLGVEGVGSNGHFSSANHLFRRLGVTGGGTAHFTAGAGVTHRRGRCQSTPAVNNQITNYNENDATTANITAAVVDSS